MGWEWEPFESNYRHVFQQQSQSTYSELQPATQSPSLTSLCARKVISDASLAHLARNSVPVTLLRDLVSEAVRSGRYSSLGVLVENWPDSVFKLQPLSLPYFTSISDDYDVEDRKSIILKSTKLVITLVNKVVKLVKTGQTCINVLDITGYPLAADFLVTILESFQAGTQSGSSASRLTLVTDLYLSDRDCLSINTSGIPPTVGIKVVVRNIYFSVTYGTEGRYYWEEEYLKTLDKLRYDWADTFEVVNVQGLELSRLDLRSFFVQRGGRADFFDILSDMFKQLRAVDLSYNAINLNGCEVATRTFKDFFTRMTVLERLDLSGNRLTNNLPVILSSTLTLQYLNLTGTQLRQADISYLARLRKLKQLDMSSNNLSNKLNILKNVFTALKQLEILEMVECSLNQTHIDDLIPSIEQLEKLEVLNLRDNEGIESVQLKCNVILDTMIDEEMYEEEIF